MGTWELIIESAKHISVLSWLTFGWSTVAITAIAWWYIRSLIESQSRRR